MYATKSIQMQSVIEFAKSLNISAVRDSNGHTYFTPNNGKALGFERISVNTMIDLHNADAWTEDPENKGWYYTQKLPSFLISKFLWNKSQASKIVQRVKCRYNKKLKDVVVQNHMVRFVDKGYENLFIGEAE